MDFKPGDIFVGIIDFFAILLPGALLSFVYADFACEHIFGKILPAIPSDKGVIVTTAFVFSAYVVGHFAFFLGSFLDEKISDPIRAKFYSEDSALLSCVLRMKNELLQEVPRYIISRQSFKRLKKHARRRLWVFESKDFLQEVQEIVRLTIPPSEPVNHHLERIKLLKPLKMQRSQTRSDFLQSVDEILQTVSQPVIEAGSPPEMTEEIDNLLQGQKGDSPTSEERLSKFHNALLADTEVQIINAYQWAKTYVELKTPAAAVEIHRYEANSKFFRSLIVVLACIAPMIIWKSTQLHQSAWAILLICLLIGGLISGAMYIYTDQRRKAIRAAYQYFIVLVKTEAKPSRFVTRK